MSSREPDTLVSAASLSPSIRATLVALLGLAIALRAVQLGANASLWFDELAVALNIAERGFGELMSQPLDRQQVAPVGFLVVLEALTRLLGVTEFALRLVPFVCGIVSVVLFLLVAKTGEVLLVSRERCSVGLLRRTRGGLGWNWRVLSPSAERARPLVS